MTDWNTIPDAEMAVGAAIKSTTHIKQRDNYIALGELNQDAYDAGYMIEAAWHSYDKGSTPIVWRYSVDGSASPISCDVTAGYDVYFYVSIEVDYSSAANRYLRLQYYNGSSWTTFYELDTDSDISLATSVTIRGLGGSLYLFDGDLSGSTAIRTISGEIQGVRLVLEDLGGVQTITGGDIVCFQRKTYMTGQ